MKYHVRHVTKYLYNEPVSLCHNLVHLMMRTSSRQRTLWEELVVKPRPEVLAPQTDYFGNTVHFFTIQEPHRQLSITAQHHVEVDAAHPLELERSPPWEHVASWVREGRRADMLDAYQYVFNSPFVATRSLWRDYAETSLPPGRPLLAGVMDLTTRIHKDFRYDPRSTNIATPLEEMFAQRRGVCQDFAHLQIACLRSLGLPARYVSGYLRTLPPAGQARLIGADASHAWIQAYCPGFGWVDFDPTNNSRPSDKHIIVACGRDYDDVSPNKGIILGGDQHTITVAVDVVSTETALN